MARINLEKFLERAELKSKFNFKTFTCFSLESAEEGGMTKLGIKLNENDNVDSELKNKIIQNTLEHYVYPEIMHRVYNHELKPTYKPYLVHILLNTQYSKNKILLGKETNFLANPTYPLIVLDGFSSFWRKVENLSRNIIAETSFGSFEIFSLISFIQVSRVFSKYSNENFSKQLIVDVATFMLPVEPLFLKTLSKYSTFEKRLIAFPFIVSLYEFKLFMGKSYGRTQHLVYY